MNAELEKILEGYRDEMAVKLQELIRIESVASAESGGGTEEAPFGKGPKQAMQYMMELGREKGFECINYNNKACELNFGEKKEDAVGIVSHVDVVPAGGEWTYPPYEGQLHDGKIYGRGAVDDKGPAIAAFYAALAIKESGLSLNKNVTQIIGSYEESGKFPCIRHYLEAAERIPSCGIVPDSYFPVCFSEKHFVNIRFTASCERPCGTDSEGGSGKVLKRIKGGTAINVVPAWAEAVFTDETGSVSETIEETGLAAHASTPEQGDNAIAKLINNLAQQEFEPVNVCAAIRELSAAMCMDTDGSGLGIFRRDETGQTTCNLGLISYEDGQLTAEVNVRLPLSLGADKLQERIRDRVGDTELEAEITHFLKGFYTDVNKEPAKTMVQVYREETGDMDSAPFANGGGSYARVMDNFIPFGIALQDEPLQFHVEDEHISVDRLMQAARIYAEALYRLAK